MKGNNGSGNVIERFPSALIGIGVEPPRELIGSALTVSAKSEGKDEWRSMEKDWENRFLWGL